MVFFAGTASRQQAQSGPAEDPDYHDPYEDPDTVDQHVSFGRSAAGHKGLVEFVQAGKAHTDASCQDQQKDASKPVDIKGERYGNGQDEIFSHMGDLPDFGMDPFSIVTDGVGIHSQIQYLISCLDDLDADPVAEIGRHLPGLPGKRKNQVHDQNCRQKRKWF